MRKRLFFCLLLLLGLNCNAYCAWAADVGWMQPCVRLWYHGGVGEVKAGEVIASSNAEEAYLINAVSGTNAEVIHHSALDQWNLPRPVETSTYSLADMGPCWIHPVKLQTLKSGDYWMGWKIALVTRTPYTSAAFPYRLLPANALFKVNPQRQFVKLSYSIPGFSVGDAYFDSDTGILLYYHTLWENYRMFFMLAEINYDFERHAAFAEDDGPHTGFKSLVSEQCVGGSVIIHSQVETRYGATVEMRTLTSRYPSWTPMADENYCFFGSVPVLKRMDATQAPNFPPEQWTPFGQYLWWWIPPGDLAKPAISVFDVPMAMTTAAPGVRLATATENPSRFHFTRIWFDDKGYMIAFSASDPTMGLDVDPGNPSFQNLTTVDGLAYYKNTMGSAASDPDFDQDGMPDKWEVKYFGNTSRDGTGDYDHDGLNDLQEYRYGTSPTAADTDGDGMPDGWEKQYGLDPLVRDDSGDKDGDGYTNLQEYKAGTNPADPASKPKRAFPWMTILLAD